MPIGFETETSIKVFLPASFEFDERLEQILNLALDQGASETSTIGPWILYEDCDSAAIAIDAVRKVLKEFDIS
jgi:hypothetical protein